MNTKDAKQAPTRLDAIAAARAKAQAKRHERALIVAIEALAFYANPDNYHAIAMLYDRPTGAFADDTSKVVHSHYQRPVHGKAARKALTKIQKIVCPEEKA